MKNLQLLLVCILAVCMNNTVLAQTCTPLILTTQADIDDFVTNNGTCTRIDGTLNISGTNITNLNGLSNLQDIGGDLIINNTNVTNLNGLHNIADVGTGTSITVGGSLMISNNSQLTHLTGLSLLNTIYGSFRIENNAALLDLDGILVLNSMTELRIEDNSALETLAGSSSITEVESVYIKNNDALTSISGLTSLGTVLEIIDIRDNDVLTSIAGAFNNITDLPSGLTIKNNDQLPNLSGAFTQLETVTFGIDISYNDALTTTAALWKIETIDGYLFIQDNDALTNVLFTSLDTIHSYLSISDNVQLTTMAFPALKKIDGYMNIAKNILLPSLSGFSALTAIGTNLYIGDNESLQNLTGLNGLTKLNFCHINTNDLLTSLDGLSSLDTITDYLSINYNLVLTDFTALSNLKQVVGTLSISNNSSITNLNGLQNLKSTGACRIRNNPLLTDLSGLVGVETFLSLTLENLLTLQSLNGLNNVQKILSYLTISENPNLTNLTALSNLTNISAAPLNLSLTENNALSDLTGLENVNAFGSLIIRDNPLLSNCEITSICTHLQAAGTSDIRGNKLGCDSAEQVVIRCGCAGEPPIIYVRINAAGNNDGSTWADAYVDLQDGLLHASLCNQVAQVWVSAGTYKPTSGTDRKIAFAMPDGGVIVYGGFSSSGNPGLANRDYETHQTILSGNIGDQGLASDNSYAVASSTDVEYTLDGFIIRDGYANYGGDAHPEWARGAGLNNTCTTAEPKTPIIRNCSFTLNYAGGHGAGFCHYSAVPGSQNQPELYNCTFQANNTGNYGGAIADVLYGVNSRGITKVVGCTFSQNNGKYGGAAASRVSWGALSTWTFNACKFEFNTATLQGGAIYSISSESTSSLRFYNSIFHNNTAAYGGAAYHKAFSSNCYNTPIYTNCNFTSNYVPSSGRGGGIYVEELQTGSTTHAYVSVDNCIFWGNVESGGAITDIFRNNTGDHINLNNSIMDMANCTALQSQSGTPPVNCSNNIWNKTPFVSGAPFNGNFLLPLNSPAIDAGDNSNLNANFTTDFAGMPRKTDGNLDNTETVDIGAHEKQTAVALPQLLNTCTSTATFASTGASTWHQMDIGGNVVIAINDNGNVLGNVNVELFLNDNAVRMHNNASYLDRNWHIDVEFSPSSPVSVRFYYFLTEYNDLNAAAGSTMSSASEMAITKFSSPTEEDCSISNNSSNNYQLLATASTIELQGQFGYHQVELAGFSEFYFHSPSQALPVELTSFTGRRINNKQVRLNWETATEINNDKFEIYKKTENSQAFNKVGEIKGNGTTTVATQYNFHDVNDFAGISYYRLKQIDYDGNYDWSKTIAIEGNEGETAVTVFPNPASDQLTIATHSKEPLNYKIFDFLGKNVHVGILEKSTNIDISALSSGVYWLQVRSKNDYILDNKKIIVTNN